METVTERTFLGATLSGRFRVDKLIGRGGMGAVYEGEQIQLGRRVAIKIFLPSEMEDESLIRRFAREARLVAKLRHPNIVAVIDYDFTETGVPFLVMEFLGGRSLREEINAAPGGIDLRRFAAWMADVCAGLEAAHRAGVVHRDLKPPNIILVDWGGDVTHPKILDFGLARRVEGTVSQALTGSGTLVGTSHYIAPEQIRGEPPDPRSDVYALGVIAFEMLAGRRPFVTNDVVQLLQKHLFEPPPDLAAIRTDAPSAVAAAIAKALAKDPAKRWASALAFGEALRRAFEAPAGGPSPADAFEARPTVPDLSGDGAAFDVSGAPAASAAAPREPARRRPKPRLGVAFAFAVLVFAVAAAVALLVLARYGSREPVRAAVAAAADAAAAVDALAPEAASADGAPDAAPADGAGLAEGAGAPWVPGPGGGPAGLAGVTIVDASPDAGRVLLSDGSSGRTWVPGEALGEPVPLRAAVAGRADCPGGWWFLRRDRRAAVRLDPATLEVAAEAPFPEPAAAAACVDAGGARWGLLSEDGTRWVVVDGGREAGSTALGRAYRAARVDPARRLVALLSREEVSIRGLDSLREVLQIPLVEPLLAEAPLAWSPAGRRIAFGFKTLHVYDVERKAALASLPARGWIRDVGWIGEDELTAADDRGRTYWARLPAQAWAGEREAAREGSYAAFWVPAHLRWFLVERGGSWEVLDYRSAGLAFEASVSSLPLWSLAVASSRGIVAASGKDVRIALVDAATGRTTRTLEGHTDGVPFVRFVPDGTLVSASDDGSIRVWNADTGEALATVTAHRSLINAFAATADGTWLVSVSSDRKVRVWKLAERLMMRELVTTESSGSAAAFLAGTDGKLLVSDWGGRLYLFEGTPPEWAEARRIRLAQGAVYMLCPAPDGWWAVVIEGDARGLWWVPAGDVRKAERVDADEIGYCHSTPDGSRTALTYATHVDLRENATRAVVATWRRARVDSNAVAVDPAAGLVLEGDGAGRLRGWRIP